jgi:2-polyprenyl-3-methyl-5-hydroxy-6-metoxy-1,4-benzoquinol methylase
MGTDQATLEYWHEHYKTLFAQGDPWLDYNGEVAQIATLTAALGAAGPLMGRCCLDAGCGHGQFARMLLALGAKVTGIDFVSAPVEGIDWHCGNLNDARFLRTLGPFEVVFLLEVLQVVPYREVLPLLWERVAPGGRMVGVLPNGSNPFVQRVCAKFSGRYAVPGSNEIQEILTALPHVKLWGVQGMFWKDDQTFVPYDLGPFAPVQKFASEPKRLLFAVDRDES